MVEFVVPSRGSALDAEYKMRDLKWPDMPY